jgi:hypothetical protein
MANEQAWTDRRILLELYYTVRQHLNSVVRLSEQIQSVKTAVLADPLRTSEFQKLMLEDPNLTTQQVLDTIAEIKTMADYVKTTQFYEVPPEENLNA